MQIKNIKEDKLKIKSEKKGPDIKNGIIKDNKRL